MNHSVAASIIAIKTIAIKTIAIHVLHKRKRLIGDLQVELCADVIVSAAARRSILVGGGGPRLILGGRRRRPAGPKNRRPRHGAARRGTAWAAKTVFSKIHEKISF